MIFQNSKQKQQILAALEASYKNTLIDQDKSRDRIEAMRSSGVDGYSDKLLSLGWSGVSNAMLTEKWPVGDEDRKKHLQQSWDEIPMRIKIEKIDDDDIRSKTYWLSLVVEHSYRIRAMARFLELLGTYPDNEDANALFGIWTGHATYTQLSDEILLAGDEQKAKSFAEMADTFGKLFDFLCQNSETTSSTSPTISDAETPSVSANTSTESSDG